ncbi:hypothetical protein V6260_00410 [Pseudoalteromonas aliena]|uniref:hypothetical protein n=1 Tax=Pseudoalteromonas aliena TaxID=247523 RepID=UPI00311EE862
MINLIHITSPDRALNIIHNRSYYTKKPFKNYDAGMNFLGVLGEYANTQPTRGSKIHCEWSGAVSEPLTYDAYDYHTPNILFDFNGSGVHFPNNDPRYFLPYNSGNLVIKRIELEDKFDEEALIEKWLEIKGGAYPYLQKIKFLKKYLLKNALRYLQDINKKLASEEVTISVKYG